MKDKNLEQSGEGIDLKEIVKSVVKNNEKAVNEFKNGKDPAIKFLVGQVMRQSKGKANPIEAEKELRNILI